jgi:trigger factor
MKTEITDISPTRKEITIEIEPGVVRQSYDRVSDRYAKLANVPGFRRGHAPRGVVRSRFKSEIRGEVLSEIVPNAVNEAIDKHELTTVGEPGVHLPDEQTLNRLGETAISIKVDVEVLPKVDLGTYRGIEVARTIKPVEEKDVDQMIEGLRDASASLQPVEDRGAELGDTISVDFVGKFIDHPEEEDIDLKDIEVVLGAEGVQKEFTDNLLGTKTDEERTFAVDYPDDFQTKRLAGKKVDYTAKVTAVKEKELPELDDEWARSLGDIESLASLRGKIREDLEARAKADADQRVQREIIRKLVETHQFEVPETLIQHQSTVRLQELVRDMMAHGIDPRGENLNWERARDEMKVQAQDDVRASVLLEMIAKEEKIDISDEEIEDEIHQIAAASQQPLEQVHATLTKQGGNRSIANRLRNRKALQLLVNTAQVTEEKWGEKELQSTTSQTTDTEEKAAASDS